MNQVDFIKKLASEGLEEYQIEEKLHEQFGMEAYKKTAIYKHMADAKLQVKHKEEEEVVESRIDQQLLIRIQQVLYEEPYASVRYIAQELNISAITSWRYIHLYLGYVYKHTRWVPHLLSENQKQIRVQEAKKLLNLLRMY